MRRLIRLWRLGGRDLRVIWTALRHPNRPSWLMPATVALAFFALEPMNFAIPVLGVVDDFVLLPLLLRALAALASQAHKGANLRSPDDRIVSVQ